MLEAGEGAQVVVVQAPAGLPHVYSLRGVYWTRTGAQNRPLTTAELRRLLLERTESGFESQPVADAKVEDLDLARVTRYLDQLGLPPDEEPVQALTSRGCITRRTPEGLPAPDSGADRGRAAALWPRPPALPAQRRGRLRALCRPYHGGRVRAPGFGRRPG